MLSKEGGYKCPTMLRDTWIRGHLVPAGEKTCYKAIYWNTDKAVLTIIAWVVAWVVIILKAYERMFQCLFARSLRWSAVAAVLAGQVTLWYGFVVTVHYVNGASPR